MEDALRNCESLLLQHVTEYPIEYVVLYLGISVGCFSFKVSKGYLGISAVEKVSPLDRNIACDVLAYSIILVHVFVQLQRTHRRALNVIPVIGILIIYAIAACISYLALVHCFTTEFDVDIILRFAIPTFLFLMDWSKCSKAVSQAVGKFYFDKVTDLDFSEIFVHYGISLVSESSLEFLVLAFGLASGVVEVEYLCTCACLTILTSMFSFFVLLPTLTSIFIQLNQETPDNEKDNTEMIAKGDRLKYKNVLSKDRGVLDHHNNPLSKHLQFIMCVGLCIAHGINFMWRSWKREYHAAERLHWISAEQFFISALIANFAFRYLLHELRESIDATFASRVVRTASSNSTTSGDKTAEKVSRGVPMADLEKKGIGHLSNDEIMQLIESKEIPLHSLEKLLKDFSRAVELRCMAFVVKM